MSYYTDYELIAENLTADERTSVDKFIENASCLEPWGDGWGGHCTWYDHENDLRKLSAKYPHAVFTLCGAGDGYEDLWRKYFKNGKMQYAPAQISYEEFDESRLRDASEEQDGG